MSVAYKDVLERFVKYREQRNISQNELAQMLRISQSYVSKMEVGKARISFEILTALYQQGWDIDYIITGQENHRTVLNDLYDSCNKERRADFLQYMVWTVRQGIKSYEKHIKQMERYIEKFEYFNMYTSGIAAEDTAFYGIRTVNRLSQVQMAKMLHVDIKKYRAMEKNEKKPDAELLMLLYNNFECMPFETIYGESDLGEINAVWRKLPPQMQDELYAFMKQGLRFIDNQTGDTKVLILEDNRQILNVLEELVMSVAEDEKVYATDNVGEAYKIAMETSIDVFLLDIILYTDKKGDTSGMQYAQSMRKLERYRFTPIIFITSLEDPEMYALRDLHAFGYIEKPFAPSQVKNLLRDALHFKTQKETDAMMFFRKDGILYPVKCNRVIYMELIKRKICIHMKNGDVLSIPYKSFREIMEEANYEKFVQCSRNCVINIDYIKNIDKTNRFITLEGTKTAVEMGGTFIKKIVGALGL